MSRTSHQIIQEEYLTARAKIIELAAILDRIDRASLEVQSSAANAESSKRLSLLSEGIDILRQPDPNRAERVQRLMSRPYEPNWRNEWTI